MRDVSEVPQAYRYEVMFCQHCPHGHLVFFDAADKPLLHAVLSVHQVQMLADTIRKNDPNFREIKC